MSHPKPQWVRPPDTSTWINAVVCDVWGVNVTWKVIDMVLSNRFRGPNAEPFRLWLLGIPSNRALIAAKDGKELSSILAFGPVRARKGVITFQPWSKQTSAIPVEATCGD